MELRIEGKKEGIRADFMDSTLEYLEKSLSNLIWGRKRGRKRIHFVVLEVNKGSFVFKVGVVYKIRGEYAVMDLAKEIEKRFDNADDLFEAEDPKELIPCFDDEYGIRKVEMSYNGKRIAFGLDEIKKYEQKLKKSYGSITGIVTSIRLTRLEGGKIEAGLKWTLNPERHIRIMLDGEKFKNTLLHNFEKPVRVTGLVYYNREGEPFRIEGILNIEPLKKIRPDIDKLIGIINLEEDGVEVIKKIRSEWENEWKGHTLKIV